MKQIRRASILIYCCFTICFSQEYPKRELRGVWVATVANLDFPSSSNQSSEDQQSTLLILFKELKKVGINCIFFQIRSECDAFYQSKYEPWSYWLTRKQGNPPDPFYDPLLLAIQIAHQLGMELHVWFNPFRAEVTIGGHPLDSSHVVLKHPEWILTFPTIQYRILNPGLEEVRDYITKIISDVAERYDIDGVHLDDYFYPYPNSNYNFTGITNEDYQTFLDNPRGIEDIEDWRRDNINLLILQIRDNLRQKKEYIKFGISPIGTYRSNVPAGISGFDAYDIIFTDPLYWIQQKLIDYLAPQCYWKIGSDKDYNKLVPWWASVIGTRHLYIGQIVRDYFDQKWTDQIAINRATNNVKGNILFRASSITSLYDTDNELMNKYYIYPALIPSMSWKDTIPPLSPKNLRYRLKLAENKCYLMWDKPFQTGDPDSTVRYAVYRFKEPPSNEEEFSKPQNILEIVGTNFCLPEEPEETTAYSYLYVTALDRNNNEGGESNFIKIGAASVPNAVYPPMGTDTIGNTVTLIWNNDTLATVYDIQFSDDQTFLHLTQSYQGYENTSLTINNLKGQTTYYWRVSARNAGGKTPFSNTFWFRTGLPGIPILLFPLDKARDIPRSVSLGWQADHTAEKYNIQVASYFEFTTAQITIDTCITQDTTLIINDLIPERWYYWRVKAINFCGIGEWSQPRNFKVAKVSDELNKRYQLYQNYPNPFNKTTTISYQIPVAASVNISIYDINGSLVKTFIIDKRPAGIYSVNWSTDNISSGIYVFRMDTGKFHDMKKCILLK